MQDQLTYGLGDWSEGIDRPASAARDLEELYARLSHMAPPTGRFARLWVFSTLPAKVAATYCVGWMRTHFASADDAERARAELHWRTALHAFGTMGYLRGAATKVGQVLASYPHALPEQVVELMAQLHSQAPPMHFSLISETLRAELGGDEQRSFAEFEREAFAAASIGQVHRARLADGTRVAVKLQYPGMARAIRADLDNLRLLLAPLRLGRNWDNLVAQLDEVRVGVARETDYLREALWTERVRHWLADFGECVVPRVHPNVSSSRVLTTDLLEAATLQEFLARSPSQQVRDRAGAALLRGVFRVWCSHRTVNSDAGPGNFLFFEDGRVGLVDFGACRELDAREWELMELGIRAQREGGATQDECVRRMAELEEGAQLSTDELAARNAMCDWLWAPMREPGAFDFGDADYIRRGAELFARALRSGYTRQTPVVLWLTRQFFGVRALLWALRARVDFHAIADEEYRRAGL